MRNLEHPAWLAIEWFTAAQLAAEYGPQEQAQLTGNSVTWLRVDATQPHEQPSQLAPKRPSCSTAIGLVMAKAEMPAAPSRQASHRMRKPVARAGRQGRNTRQRLG